MYNQEHRKLEIECIKRDIDIILFLHDLGHKPAYFNYDRVWYYSPFRDEDKPSLCVYKNKNDWYDFGEKVGGSIIDLTIKLFRISYIEAIKMLRKRYNMIIKKQNNI